MAYTLHFELSDGTLDKPYHSVGGKRRALQYARKAAADKPWGVSNIVVCDQDELAIATFNVRPFGVDE